MENPPKARRGRNPHSLVQVQVATGALNPVEKVRSFHFHQTLATDVGKADTKKHRTAKLWMQHAEDVERKDTLRRFASRGKCSTHSLEIPQASTSTAGAGAGGEPLYFDDGGQPVYTYMVSVPPCETKHLIKFPIALDHTTLRNNKNNAHSPQSVLLKADTGADVNLMNRKTFDQLFGEAKGVLQLTPIKMENYGNTAVKVLGMFHAFLRWKDKVYK